MFLKSHLIYLLSQFSKWRLNLINRFAYGNATNSIMSDSTEDENPPIRTGGGTLP